MNRPNIAPHKSQVIRATVQGRGGWECNQLKWWIRVPDEAWPAPKEGRGALREEPEELKNTAAPRHNIITSTESAQPERILSYKYIYKLIHLRKEGQMVAVEQILKSNPQLVGGYKNVNKYVTRAKSGQGPVCGDLPLPAYL